MGIQIIILITVMTLSLSTCQLTVSQSDYAGCSGLLKEYDIIRRQIFGLTESLAKAAEEKKALHQEIAQLTRPKDVCLTEFGPFGYPGGSAFSDEDVFKQNRQRISKIRINHGSSIDCIQVTYGRNEEAVMGPCHGGSGGRRSIITLKKYEFVVRVVGMYAGVVNMLTFITNRKTYGPYGNSNGKSFTATGDGHLAYISGRQGRLLDQISFHFYCE